MTSEAPPSGPATSALEVPSLGRTAPAERLSQAAAPPPSPAAPLKPAARAPTPSQSPCSLPRSVLLMPLHAV